MRGGVIESVHEAGRRCVWIFIDHWKKTETRQQQNLHSSLSGLLFPPSIQSSLTSCQSDLTEIEKNCTQLGPVHSYKCIIVPFLASHFFYTSTICSFTSWSQVAKNVPPNGNMSISRALFLLRHPGATINQFGSFSSGWIMWALKSETTRYHVAEKVNIRGHNYVPVKYICERSLYKNALLLCVFSGLH